MNQFIPTGTRVILELEQLKTKNIELITFLHNFDYCSGRQCRKARKAYLEYKDIQFKIEELRHMLDCGRVTRLTYGNTRATCKHPGKHKKMRLIQLKSTSCELCGNPMTDVLEIHHIIPQSMNGGGNEENLIILCPTCHKLTHQCISNGGINDKIRDYYSMIDGAIEKFELLVKKGMPEQK